jgi:dolichol-phosphate mannosyltransferase
MRRCEPNSAGIQRLDALVVRTGPHTQAQALRRGLAPGSRLRAGLKRQANWLQLLRFGIVGISGYIANLGTFAVGVHAVSLDYRLAATASFVVAVSNNFVWHRLWTFAAADGQWTTQGTRFLAVSFLAFVTSVVILQGLVSVLGLEKVLAQAIALAAVVPVSFVCNKIWSFRR